MKSTIWFIYHDHPATSFEIEANPKETAEEIKYWLGKSPGMYDIAEILVVASDASWLRVKEEFENKRVEDEVKRREIEERKTFEKLKKKFEP